MLGHPKYEYGDVVTFKVDGKVKNGIVAIIDKYGTFFDNSDVSYDIYSEEENILYKHFGEKFIIEKIGHEDEDEVFKRVFG